MKHSNHFKNIKTTLTNDPFDKAYMNNTLYFTSKYLKWSFEKKSYEIGFIKHGPALKFLLSTVQHVLDFTSTYLKRTFENVT